MKVQQTSLYAHAVILNDSHMRWHEISIKTLYSLMMSSVNTHKRPQILLCYYFMWEIAQIIQFHKAALLFNLAFVKLIRDILLKRKMYGQRNRVIQASDTPDYNNCRFQSDFISVTDKDMAFWFNLHKAWSPLREKHKQVGPGRRHRWRYDLAQ